MFPVKIVLLCSAIFVFADGKSYGKNWYPKKYMHTIHKRVDPDYWEDLPLENNFLISQLSPNEKLSSTNETKLVGNSFWLYQKEYFPIDKDSYKKLLKRYKRDDSKIKNQKAKKYKETSDKKKSTFYSKYEKGKKL